jgi:hypothetical protein
LAAGLIAELQTCRIEELKNDLSDSAIPQFGNTSLLSKSIEQ